MVIAPLLFLLLTAPAFFLRGANKRGATMQFDFTGLESYATDKEIEAQDGIWLKFPEGRKIHVLRAGGANKKYQRRLSQLVKPHKRQMERNTLDPEVSDEIVMTAFLDTVVIDWTGFTDSKGADIPFSKQAARELFTALPELFDEVMTCAQDMALFQDQDAQETAEEMGKS
jgi:hypothetical protein